MSDRVTAAHQPGRAEQPRTLELASTHLEHGAEAYKADAPVAVTGIVRQAVHRGSLNIVFARFRLDAPLSSQVLLPPGLSLSLVLGGRAALADGDCHGAGTYALDLSRASRWRRLHALPGQEFSFVSISASLDGLESLGLDRLTTDTGPAQARCMPTRVAELARLLARPCPSGPAAALVWEAASLEIIGRLLDDPDSSALVRDARITAREQRALDEVRAIVASELGTDLSLGGLARRVGLGLSRLKTLYRLRYETALGASIVEARLTHAHMLLREEKRQVAEVAYAVGYTPAHFATAFRRRFGCPPSSVWRTAGR